MVNKVDVRPGSRASNTASRWMLPLLAIALFALGALAWRPSPAGVWHDDGVYLLIGQSLAEGGGLSYAGVPAEPPAVKFPPLFPALVAGWSSVVPDLEGRVRWITLTNLALLGASAALFAVLVSSLPAFTLGGATLLASLVWLSPALWRVASVPVSEPLFLLTLLAGLLALHRHQAWRGGSVVLLFVFMLAFYTRTVGVVLAIAYVLDRLIDRRFREAGMAIVGCTLVIAPWVLWSSRASRNVPEPLMDVLGPYGPWLLGQAVNYPREYAAFLLERPLGMIREIGAILVPGLDTFAGGWLALALLIPFALGGRYLWRGSRPLTIALSLYLTIVWLWPFESTRLLVPAVPLLAVTLVQGVRASSTATQRPSRRLVPTLMLGLLAAWYVAHSAWALSTRRHLEAFELRGHRLTEAVDAIERLVPPDAVVGAPEAWAAIHLHTGRAVVPSARFLPMAIDPPSWGSPEQQIEIWRTTGVDYVLAEHGGAIHGAALDRIEAACPGSVTLAASLPGQLLARVAWNAECTELLGSND
jgi:hypothetical protein